MNRVLNLAAFNIRVLLGDPTWFILSWALFALQLAIYGSFISRLVGSNLPNYFLFYSIGLMIIVVFESAEDVGRHFVEHAHEGELPYFLSLPVSRSGFLVAQAIYGVVNTLLKVAPPLLAVLFIWGNLTVSGALFAWQRCFFWDWVSQGRWYLCLSSLSKRWTFTWRSWRDSLLFSSDSAPSSTLLPYC